ncbi:hypothetical protein LB505_008558 [Fusarium chuoi]|nr:hypothetical protein LB505_008558 [Fusarium chuoi]
MSTTVDVGCPLVLLFNLCSSKTLSLPTTEDLEFEEALSTSPHNWEWLDARQHYSKDLIRVNAVCPGLIDTAMTRPQADVLSPAINIAPMGRMGSPQEVADCILFLASSKASFVQGAAMMVDGGYVIN